MTKQSTRCGLAWGVLASLGLISASIATAGFGPRTEPQAPLREVVGQTRDGSFASYGKLRLDLDSLAITRFLPISAFQADVHGALTQIHIERIGPSSVPPPAESVRVREAVFSSNGRLLSWTQFGDEENPPCYLRLVITENGTGASCHKQGCEDRCKIEFFVEPPPPGGGDEVVRIWRDCVAGN